MYAVGNAGQGHAVVKADVNGFVISMSFDDSAGLMRNMYRNDIRVFYNVHDVTRYVFDTTETVPATIDNLVKARDWVVNEGPIFVQAQYN